MKKTVLMVVNPISGDVDKSEIIQETKFFSDALDLRLVILETTGKNDHEAIINAYHLHKPERVLIAGGDGTIKIVAEALETKNVIFGILPAGSSNGLSVDLDFPSSLPDILKIAFLNDPMEMDMIEINGTKCLHLSDLGLNAELVKNYENSTTRGKLGYALQTFTTLSDSKGPFEAKIKVNNEELIVTARIIILANSQKYGTGVTINPLGKMDDGKFEIVIIKNLDLMVFGKIITGNMPLDSDDVMIISTDRAVIETEEPVPFQIDGEFIGEQKKLEIVILNKQMKIAVPAINS
ncbi:diacylglycerol kinase family protein [Flavobacterium sp.]|uniref:diacylglycerol/lipid kinase family protein n=1 Tax=Flavobacterium sp. TaxID=239 RepID=UPI00260F6400|nr:diacylglycerol kinase family protein [Flavobacterium sp.]MDD3004972.1 diacylglycerol kinase family protein [Flavobacterium sp.]